MSSPHLSNFRPTKMQIVGINSDDHSPDLRFGVEPGVGSPATFAQGPMRAQNNYHINITNQPGAIIDVGKIQDMVSPAQKHPPALLPAPTHRPPPQRLNHKDLRLTLAHKRPLPHSVEPAPEPRIPTAPTVPAPPAHLAPETTSAKRRCRAYRSAKRLITEAISHLPPPPPDDRISVLVAAVNSMQEELKAQRVQATSAAPPCARAPSSPPGPPPDADSDSMFSLALRNRYVPLSSTLGGRAPPARTPDMRPHDLDSSFRALRDSDPLLRRRTSRSRSPSRSSGPHSRRRRLELDTPTSSDVCRFLSPIRRGFSRPHRYSSPPRRSRSSSSSWSYHEQRDSRRDRPASPPRPTLRRDPPRRSPPASSPPTRRALRDAPVAEPAALRAASAGPPPTGLDLPAAPNADSAARLSPSAGLLPTGLVPLDTSDAAAATAPDNEVHSAEVSSRTSTTEAICAAVRETLTAVVHSKDAQWDAVRHNLSGKLLQLYSSNAPTRPPSALTEKIAGLQRIVSAAAAGWESACVAPAGTLLDELSSDHPPTVTELDAITASDAAVSPEVTNKGTGTRPGSPFSPAREDPASSSPLIPGGARPVPPPPGNPLASTSLGVVLPRLEPLPPPSRAAPSTSRNLLGECLSGPEDFTEEAPRAAPARAQRLAIPCPDAGPPIQAGPAGPSATEHTAEPEPTSPGTKTKRSRLKLLKSKSSDSGPRAPRYRPLSFVPTTSPFLSALNRSTGRAVGQSFSPSPPRHAPPARPAAPPPPAARRRGLVWPTSR